MPNVNRVRNGGFEQSTPPSVGPFWTGSAGAVTETGGTQLLGGNNALLPSSGDFIEQPLLPLQVGEIYTFQAAFATFASTGTIDVEIVGETTRLFQAVNVEGPDYGFYKFDFTASDAAAVLRITNSSNSFVRIDVVSVKVA